MGVVEGRCHSIIERKAYIRRCGWDNPIVTCCSVYALSTGVLPGLVLTVCGRDNPIAVQGMHCPLLFLCNRLALHSLFCVPAMFPCWTGEITSCSISPFLGQSTCTVQLTGTGV